MGHVLFKDYVKRLNEILDENPETGDMDVIYSTDGEGNSFHVVYYTPSIGFYQNNDFTSVDDDEYGDKKPNAVCIN